MYTYIYLHAYIYTNPLSFPQAPHRLVATLREIAAAGAAGRGLMAARELTKLCVYYAITMRNIPPPLTLPSYASHHTILVMAIS